MKKYLFVFTLLAALATAACDTSSKASTTQTLTTAPPTTQTVAATAPATDSVVTPVQPIQMTKKGFVKKGPGSLERQPMTPEEKHRLLKGPPEVPAKKQ